MKKWTTQTFEASPNGKTVISKRPIIFSNADEEALNVERTKAKFFRQLIKRCTKTPPRPKEFSSCFYGSQSGNPAYLVTSHESTEYTTLKKETILPAFTSKISPIVHWNPYVETAETIYPTIDPKQSYHCHCEKCLKAECPSKNSNYDYDKPTLDEVQNEKVKRFRDESTMTTQVADVATGVKTPPEIPTTSDVRAALDTDPRDSQAPCYGRCPYDTGCELNSILKTSQSLPKREAYHSCKNDYEDFTNYLTAAKGTDDGTETPRKTRSIKSLFRSNSKKSCARDQNYNHNDKICCERKTVYNEGISDDVIGNASMKPRRIASSMRINRRKIPSPAPCPKKSAVLIDSDTPYSHRPSKYHQSCKVSDGIIIDNDYCDNPECVDSCPLARRLKSRSRSPSPIRLPKRVLTSERDIDFLINRHPRCR